MTPETSTPSLLSAAAPAGPPLLSGEELLLPYQQRWIADTRELKICEKSRRTGLTWAEAADAVLEASAAKGLSHLYLGAGKEMAQEFIEAAALWARSFQRAASEIEEEIIEDEGRDILTYVIRFASGRRVQALSSNPSNLRGRKGNVTLDEAAHHPDLAEVLKAALPLRRWGGKVRLISTHNGADHLFAELISDSRAGKQPSSVHRITLDDACREGLYRRICQVRGLEWSREAEVGWKEGLMGGAATREDALEEYYCVPKRSTGAYLSRALIESCMVEAPVLRFEGSEEFNAWPEALREAEMRDWCEAHLRPLLGGLDPDLPHAFGEDFGRSGDLTVLAPLSLGQDLTRRVPCLVELRNVPFRQQEQGLNYLVDRLPRLMAGALDARGNGQYLAEQAAYRYGSRIEAVMLSQGWYLEHMPPFKAAFEDSAIELPRDREVLDDLRALQVVRGIPRLPETQTGEQKNRHGDAAIALALAHYASRREVEVFDYRAVASRYDPEADREWRPVRATAGFQRGVL